MRLSLTSEAYSALKQRRLRVALLVELEFQLQTIRFWTRAGQLQWQGVTWYGSNGALPTPGAGTVLISIGKVTETNEIKSTAVAVGLSGMPIVNGDGKNMMRLCTEYAAQGNSARFWLALFNLNTNALIADPSQFYTGQLDVPIIEPSSDSFAITINVASRLDILQGHCGLRYNLESHQRDHPGDLGFEFTSRSLHQEDNFA